MIPGPSRDLTIRPIPQLSRCQKVKHNRLFVKVLPMDQELPLAIGQGRLNVYDYFSNLCARLLVDGYGRDGRRRREIWCFVLERRRGWRMCST